MIIPSLVLKVALPPVRAKIPCTSCSTLFVGKRNSGNEIDWNGKLFCVCCVCVQDQSSSNFENNTMQLSVNETKLTGLWAKNCATM